jgi:glycosyltransferase involved in cell wall biosynthesis
MCAVDVLLMPYQANVSIGLRGHDTARWMSPMKMFEYLGSGVPIISSDLPALREVLTDGRNALLVAPDDRDAWLGALDRLVSDPELAGRLGAQGHSDYLERFTWDTRAKQLLDLAQPF